ncbi:hypothetical protein HUJ04_002532 [Dendroctonus ponderosae]|uniref:C2H2-type domain-containing protein n=1 Tax=Dendroctonus ponderosae TaxID=77166 RepID=A0AAR5PFJ5_DENPD|nr:hypothetical protein HUJ04_002532 [Dendroctonus ponderosae]
MYTLPNFCRVCLKYDKNLIDLAHIENEPSETLMSKLALCVSEVEWNAFKPLLCHPCIKRLNIAYGFKKQCMQSAGVLKNYVELVKESQKKNESQSTINTENSATPGGSYMLLPNQKYVKILVGSQNQSTTGKTNSFQNVFLNLVPSTTISSVSSGSETGAENSKDTNQNVFLNLNNTFQKFIPISPAESPPLKNNEASKRSRESLLKANVNNVNVNDLLTESKAEEMSVEIDPTSFLSVEHDNPSSSDGDSRNDCDWDEMITKQKLDYMQAKSKANGSTSKYRDSTNFVPILPKDDYQMYSGGHFLSSSSDQSDISCESCQRSFHTLRLLKQHLKQFHLGKLPFKCDYCYAEFLRRSDYESCLYRHKKDQEVQNTSLTLKDFTGNSSYENDALSISIIAGTPADQNLEPNENGEYVCEVCKRIFNSSAGLLRHRVRKHNQKNRKKYFIKGMKNARCDICKREFSTQSYMQLHRKLHLREDGGYKYKVQGRSKYKNIEGEEEEKDEAAKQEIDIESKENESETVNVTSDGPLAVKEDQNESDSETDSEPEHSPKKQKLDDCDSSDSQDVKEEYNSKDKSGGSSSSSSNDEQPKKSEEPEEEDGDSESSRHSDSNCDEQNDDDKH